MNATRKAAYLWLALLIDHGPSNVRLNKSGRSFKVTLTKAVFSPSRVLSPASPLNK